MIWDIVIIVLLVLLNGVFAMSEMAVVSSRRARLQQLAEARGGGAKAALALADDPSRFLSTIQVGITLVGVVAGAFGGASLAEPLGAVLDGFGFVAPYGAQVAFALVVAAITYLSLIVGELVPKRLALANPERIAIAVAGPMTTLSRLAGPLVWLLDVSSRLVLAALGQSGTRDQTVTEEEVKTLIAEGTEHGVFEPAERLMIEGVLRLSDRTVRSIMTPRPDVAWIDIDDPPDAVAREIAESGYSRFPVCRGDVDEVQGIVSAKDLLDQALHGKPFDLRAVLADALVVHDGTRVMRLLELFRQASAHIAVVVDEYGSVEGLVTVTDILEAIAGEFPEEGEESDRNIVRRDDGSWLVDGMAPVEEVALALGLPDMTEEEGDFHTIAGFVLHRLGHLPVAAESFAWNGIRFEVVDMDGRRIDKILISRPVPAAEA